MALEIERKFLVADDRWKQSVVGRVRIRDGLIASSNGNKARVRISDSKATIALKSRRRGSTRSEFEYEIPGSDAEEILRAMCQGHMLEKVRHFVSYAGSIWYVDVYDGVLSGVILAEIELARANQELQPPAWVGREVTSDPEYRKVNLLAQRTALPEGRQVTTGD